METNGNNQQQKSRTVYRCENCDYETVRQFDYENHILTAKHKMATNGNAESRTIYRCEICNYETVRKNDYDKHILTARHIARNSATKSRIETSKCENCNKSYASRNGLWKHKKKCVESKQPVVGVVSEEIVLSLIKQNAEMVEIIKTVASNNCNNNNNNTITNANNNNKTFNLNFFLNETCKDAINIQDFADTLSWDIQKLEMVGNVGYVKGVSNIITENLNLLEENKRPIHCTDAKRNVIYVKENGKFIKEEEGNPKMHKMVRQISSSRLILPELEKYKNLHPDHSDGDKPEFKKYQRILVETVCGGESDDPMSEKEDLIIKNISKEVTINKTGCLY